MGVRQRAAPALFPPPGHTKSALILLSLLLLVVTSCTRRNEAAVYQLGTEGASLEGTATLLCSDACRDSSQCGTIDANWVILASSTGPATEFHDLTFPADTEATILANNVAVVQSVSDPAKEAHLTFYAVDVADHGSGWVAGWCIGQEIVP